MLDYTASTQQRVHFIMFTATRKYNCYVYNKMNDNVSDCVIIHY